MVLPALLSNMINIHSIAIVLFNCCCAILALYMTIKQFETYFKNEDESVISFEEISESSPDDFATYTLCIVDDYRSAMYKIDEWIYENPMDSMIVKHFLKLENNKLVLKNSSTLQNGGDFVSLYNVDDPLHGDLLTNFYHGNDKNVVYCKTGEPISSGISWDYWDDDFSGCKGIEDEVQIYVSELKSVFAELMAIKKDGKIYVIRARHYQDLLIGYNTVFKFSHKCFDIKGLTCKMVPIKYSLQDIKSLDFDEHTVDMELFLLDYEIKAPNESKSGWSSDFYQQIEENRTFEQNTFQKEHIANDCEFVHERRTHSTSNPFIKVYQDPKRKCYSTPVHPGMKKKRERITMDLIEILNHFEKSWDGSLAISPFLEVYVHPQGQFMRSIGKEIASYGLADLLSDCTDLIGRHSVSCYGSSLSFDLSQVTLLKSRHDAETPCDRNMIDEDTKILETVLNQTGIRCIPMYWKSIIKNDFNYSECTTDLQYQMIARATANFTSYEMVRSSFIPPCKEMIIITNVGKAKGRKRDKYNVKNDWDFDELVYLDINFRHLSERYQEISNLRGITGEGCWAGIGGFVGIFVGISLMQVPDILIHTFNYIKKMKKYV